MCGQLLALPLDADILFLDDNSPDGTGQILDEMAAENPRVRVVHRQGKQGIGSAHLHGIGWAYEHGYQTLVTLDCDFTHSPADIPRLLEMSATHDVVVGSRYLRSGSLPRWNPHRRFLTHFGHFLTRWLLRMPYDATGAMRVYRLDRIPRKVFELSTFRGYAFLFETLFLLDRNEMRIGQVPIVLPSRTYGHSKMGPGEAMRSGRSVLALFLAESADPARFRIARRRPELDASLVDSQGWDAYWDRKETASNALYEVIAAIYRTSVIKRRLNYFIRRHFSPGSRLLHAGCGGGQVDVDLQHDMKITAVDISPAALQLYAKNNPAAQRIKQGSILDLPFAADSFDGAYNMGVVEHFTQHQIRQIFCELRRIVRPGGKVVVFWPHVWASSVLVLHAVHWILNRALKRNVQLHPPEISLLRSSKQAQFLISQCGLEMVEYYFGLRDGFVQAVVVARKPLQTTDANPLPPEGSAIRSCSPADRP